MVQNAFFNELAKIFAGPLLYTWEKVNPGKLGSFFIISVRTNIDYIKQTIHFCSIY